MNYPKHEDLTDKSIEDWAALYDISTDNCEPLPDEISKVFIHIIFTQSRFKSNPEKLNELKTALIDASGMPALVITRIECMNLFDFDPFAAYLIASISRSPGEAVMYIWISAYILKKLNRNYLTVQDICEHLCPFGIPKKDYMQQMWDLQKIEYNKYIVNMLDNIEFGKSLILKSN